MSPRTSEEGPTSTIDFFGLAIGDSGGELDGGFPRFTLKLAFCPTVITRSAIDLRKHK